jgi:hypothetical protein
MLNVCILLLIFVFVDEGRIISPAYGRKQQRELLRLRAMSVASPLETGGTES